MFMRGTDDDHHIHVTELGEPGFIGLAFYAAREDDLKEISKADGASQVHEIDEPGGGIRVTLTYPNGLQIEIIHGIEPLEALDVRELTYNTGFERYNRIGAFQRVAYAGIERQALCSLRHHNTGHL